MVILYCRSPRLRRILSINVNKNTLTHIKLPNILPETFQVILRYIYGGRLSLKEYDNLDIIKILVASSELGLQELINHLQLFLIKNKKNWMERNFSLIYKTSFENNSFSKLQNFCAKLMSNEPEKIFNSIDFTSLSEKILISLIQHDNFQMKYIQVWEKVLKWGIAQNPGLSSDPSSYSKDDFNILKDTLQQCIPFIKFYNLTPKEFVESVYPYKKIIPKELRENLIKDFIYQPSKKLEPKMTKEINSRSIDSKIITIKHGELISKWIEKLNITDKMKNSYEFKLILRGSRDGFSSRTFHEICDNQTHTISIIKVKDSNEIFGGYNPIIWKSDFSFGTTLNSFIFSFKDKYNLDKHILSRVKRAEVAIYNDPDRGPSFGRDLILYGSSFYDKSTCRYSACYDKPIRDIDEHRNIDYKFFVGEFFSVEEYEIFQIMKD
ncbi:carbohydrate-binding module family 13 protein [Rhizophagus clarus]|nr:carbohydrate-binding module family 13 protein [Rhizophagus clarus]